MKNFIKSEQNSKLLKPIFLGWLTGMSILVFLIIVEAFFMLKMDLSLNISNVFALLSLGLSCMLGGFFGAKSAESKIMLTGLFIGIFMYFSVLLLSLIIGDGAISVNTFLKGIVFVVVTVIGASLSVFISKEKKYI